MSSTKSVGITVLPEYVQSEGIEPVLDRIQRAGATSVTTSPYVMELADPETGCREPPIDAGAGSVRLLDRPLWGSREVWVRAAPSFVPGRDWYQGLRYQPSAPTRLTETEGQVVARFIQAAQARGLNVYFQVQAAIPPGYRVQFGGPTPEDRPLLPDGSFPDKRVANNASLASPDVIAYQHALIRDLCQQYPNIDGFRFDWPEYPPYELDSVFMDFSPHAEAAADRLGFDFPAMQQDVHGLWKFLQGSLTDSMLAQAVLPFGIDQARRHIVAEYPAVLDWLRFKAALSFDLLQGFRHTMDQAGGASMAMLPNAFPPPWSTASGFDFQQNGTISQGICVKLYGMHWAMMLRSYGDQLLQTNQVSSAQLVQALVKLLDIADDQGHSQLEDYRYPEPHEPHPCGTEVQQRKIRHAQQAAGGCPVLALAHAYGPVDDFERRLAIALAASDHGVLVNRYAYLADEKLDAMQRVIAATE